MSISANTRGGSRLVEIAVIGVLVIVLFLALIWLTRLRGVEETPESIGSSASEGPGGALALYKWLEKTGFQVTRTGVDDQFPPSANTLFMINPNDDFPTGQATIVRDWVKHGNTLILAVGASAGLGGDNPMLCELGVSLAFSPGYSGTVPVSQPLFNRPPVSLVKMPGTFALEVPQRDAIPLVSTQDENGKRLPLAAMLKVGTGRVFVLASDYPLSNAGLRDVDNGAFVYNLAQMSGGTSVAFDEVHHTASTGGDLIALLTHNPWGWAIIYATLLAVAYALWSARRLGPPLPEMKPDQRRPTSDYVIAVAGLFRRARKPGYAAERYLRFFKRTLTRHAELDPYLTDTRFVQSLSERGRHTFNPDEMLHAIERLRQLEGVGEGRPASEGVELETLKAIREAERVRREALGSRE